MYCATIPRSTGGTFSNSTPMALRPRPSRVHRTLPSRTIISPVTGLAKRILRGAPSGNDSGVTTSIPSSLISSLRASISLPVGDMRSTGVT